MGERCTTRWSARTTWTSLPHLRAGRFARNAAGLPGAPPAGKRRQLVVREPDRRRSVPIDTLLPTRSKQARAAGWPAAPGIPLPLDLFGAERKNSAGLDLANEDVLRELSAALAQPRHWHGAPLIDGAVSAGQPVQDVTNPAQSARHRRPGGRSERRRCRTPRCRQRHRLSPWTGRPRRHRNAPPR
jgi:delta 1-pyrroline-5-carboxylate dehydrogenase